MWGRAGALQQEGSHASHCNAEGRTSKLGVCDPGWSVPVSLGFRFGAESLIGKGGKCHNKGAGNQPQAESPEEQADGGSQAEGNLSKPHWSLVMHATKGRHRKT